MFAHLRRNWLSWMTLLVLLLLFISVEQIWNLFELPRFGSGAPWTVTAGLYGFVAGLVVVYVVADWWVVPFDQKRLLEESRGIKARVRTFVDKNRFVVVSVATSVAAACFVTSALVDGSYLLDRSVLISFGLFAVAAAVLFATWRRLAASTQRLLSRALIVLVVFNLLGELLWYLGHEQPPFSPRNYSLWAILHVFFCAFLFARIVDVWQSYNEFPIRGFALALCVVAVGWASASNVGRVRPLSTLTASAFPPNEPLQESDSAQLPASDCWLTRMSARLEAIPDDGPVILIAASGGGSRAALFTSLVYEDLEREIVSYGEQGREFAPAKHILLISSVSGGTLASSCYLDREHTRLRTAEQERSPLKNSTEEELVALMRDELDEIKDLRWFRRVDPNTGEVIVNFAEQAADELQSESLPWFLRCPFADDMCTDFMAPLLRGGLHPGRDRGESTRRYWQTRFGLEEKNLEWFRRAKPDPGETVAPLLMCNVTEVERGSRLIIGFPPLPPGFLSHGGGGESRALIDLDSKRLLATEISLGDATRVSANFPWGFPIASVRIPQFDESGNETQSDVHLIDGGVCDNTGVDSIRYVIESLAHWAELGIPEERIDSEAELQRRRRSVSRKILEELKKRGVILLEIDSGAKPERPGALARFLSGILEPVDALQNASYSSATAALRTHLDVLDRTIPSSRAASLTDRIAHLKLRSPGDAEIEDLNVMNIVNVKRLTITCNHQENVMTAWALGPSDKAQIFVRFLVGRERLRYELREFLEEYVSSRSALEALEVQVAELERADEIDVEALSEIVAARNDVVAISQAAQNLASLRIGSEKMFYQGVALPQDVLERVDDEIRTMPNWNRKLPHDVVPEVPQAEAPGPAKESASRPTPVYKYERIQQAADEIDWNLKQKRRSTLNRIKEMSTK